MLDFSKSLLYICIFPSPHFSLTRLSVLLDRQLPENMLVRPTYYRPPNAILFPNWNREHQNWKWNYIEMYYHNISSVPFEYNTIKFIIRIVKPEMKKEREKNRSKTVKKITNFYRIVIYHFDILFVL